MVMTEDFESSSLGSIPSETFIASLAQLVERTAVNREVTGSNPVWSEKNFIVYINSKTYINSNNLLFNLIIRLVVY